MGFPGSSDGKESACNAGDLGLIPGWEEPPGGSMATHFSILAWGIPWTEKPGGLQFMGSKRAGHDWVITHMQAWVWTEGQRLPNLVITLVCGVSFLKDEWMDQWHGSLDGAEQCSGTPISQFLLPWAEQIWYQVHLTKCDRQIKGWHKAFC